MALQAAQPGWRSRPIAFEGCAGWLHPARGPTGVVLCSPWGFEALCLRRAWRMLADQLAQAGYPTLRFDYPGTGDSLGDPQDVAGMATLEAAALQAVRRLKTQRGVRRIVLVGQGLGATVAARIAAAAEADGLALLAPAARGRDYLRELSVWGATVAETMQLTLEPAEPGDIAGFALPEGLRGDLAELDIAALEAAPAPKVLVARRAGRASDARVADHLRGLGCDVAETDYAGYDAALGNPTAAQPPVEVIGKLAAWLSEAFGPGVPATESETGLAPPLLEGPDYIETAVRFGTEGMLCGVLCEPRGRRRGATVLMLSAGADPHIGWARCNVNHARALAAFGVASLRMDATDVGDSAGELSGGPVRLYDERHVGDAVAGIEWLEARGLGPVLPVGRCSGAFAGFNAAARDGRIGGLILVNQLRYIWNRDGDFELASEKVGHYRKQAKNPFRLALRWLRGELDLTVALRQLSRAAVALAQAKLTGQAQRRRRQIRETFGGLQKRGVRIRLLISRDREAHEVFRQFFGDEGRRLKRYGDLDLEILEGADHALTTASARARLLEVVREMALTAPEASARAVTAGEAAPEREDFALRSSVRGGLLPT